MKRYTSIFMGLIFALSVCADVEKAPIAKIYAKAKFVRFRDGVISNDTQPAWIYAEIPEKYEGWRITTTRTTKEDPLQFKVKEAGIVTLVTRPQHKKTLEENGWALVSSEAKLNGHVGLLIFEKRLDKGVYAINQSTISQFGIRLLIDK